MPQYPAVPASFTTKQTGDTIEAQHINDLQEEVIVLTDNLLNGLAHHVIPAVTNLYDLGTAVRKWRHIQHSGNLNTGGSIIAGGSVTAPGFIGSGAGLTGVPIAGVLDDLTNVVAPAPANGEVLTFDLTTGNWINKPITLPGGGVANLNDLLDVTLIGPVEGQMLVFRSGQWVNETVALGGGGTPTPPGVIAMYGGAAAPTGYLFCDGAAVSRAAFAALFAAIGAAYGAGDGSTTFNVPDMRLRFPLGRTTSGATSILGAIFGSWDHTHSTPGHSHGIGSLAVASHSHSSGTLAVESHSHPAGGLVAASHAHAAAGLIVPNHAHGLSITIDGVGDHSHGVVGNSDAAGDHIHGIDLSTFTGGADTGSGIQLVRPSTYNTHLSGIHQHFVNFPTSDSGGHSHSASGTAVGQGDMGVTGQTAAAAAGVTGSTGAATPALSGNTGAAAPGITGTVAADPGGATGTANPPSLVVNYIIKT